MKNSKANLILIGMTAISALAAVCLVSVYINSQVSTAREELEEEYASLTGQHDLVEVLVCGVDIPAGAVIREDDLVLQKISRLSIGAAQVFSSPEPVIGQRIQQNMYEGEWLVAQRLAAPAAPAASSKVKLGQGNRAMRLWLDATAGLLGLVAPRDRVDVLAVMPGGGKEREEMAKIILQNIRVLSVGNRLAPEPGQKEEKEKEGEGKEKPLPKATTVTLEVTPEQALDLTLAMEIGKLHLALRNSDDQETVVASPGLSQARLRAKGKKAVRRAVRRSGRVSKKETVTIISGDTVNTEVLSK
ncbi:MAG: Flp pilus assembly protein CpaB [Thermodesulfobacteriota bacterium]